MSTRRGQDYRENAAVAAAIAAVATANDATAATNMMDCHAGDLFSGGGGEETAIEAVNEAINVAINDYAATFDIDEEGVNIYVGDRDGGKIGDGDGRGDGAGGGGVERGIPRKPGEIRCCFPIWNYCITSRRSLALNCFVHAKAIASASLAIKLFVLLFQVIWFGLRGNRSTSKIP